MGNKITNTTIPGYRKVALTIAESIDAFRVIPRLILFVYGWMVWIVATWYMSIPSANQTQCQADVLKTLLDQHIPMDQARAAACSIIHTIGGPTSEQTMFVSIFTGLSSVVIGLYLNSGKAPSAQTDVLNTIQPANTLAGSYHPSPTYQGESSTTTTSAPDDSSDNSDDSPEEFPVAPVLHKTSKTTTVGPEIQDAG